MSRETIFTCNQCRERIDRTTMTSPPAGNHIQLAGVRWMSEMADFCCWTCFYEWVTKHNKEESAVEAQIRGQRA